MKFVSKCAVLAALCSVLQAGSVGPVSQDGATRLAALKSHVVVTQVTGNPQYAYEGTGWRMLSLGKILKPGATVRTRDGSSVMLRLDDASFIKVSPGTRLHLTSEAPPEERAAGRRSLARN